MAASNATPVVGSPAFPHPFVTPSPTFPLGYPSPSPLQTGSSKGGPRRGTNLALRSSAFVFAFASAVALAAAPRKPFSFFDHSEFIYSFAAAMITTVYSAAQLLKAIREIASMDFLLSEAASDKITFVLDQVLAYTLLSSSSVCVLGIEKIKNSGSRNVGIASACLSFVAFSSIAISALRSGYRLCKRIIW